MDLKYVNYRLDLNVSNQSERRENGEFFDCSLGQLSDVPNEESNTIANEFVASTPTYATREQRNGFNASHSSILVDPVQYQSFNCCKKNCFNNPELQQRIEWLTYTLNKIYCYV
jgi:hypothetical protein